MTLHKELVELYNLYKLNYNSDSTTSKVKAFLLLDYVGPTKDQVHGLPRAAINKCQKAKCLDYISKHWTKKKKPSPCQLHSSIIASSSKMIPFILNSTDKLYLEFSVYHII